MELPANGNTAQSLVELVNTINAEHRLAEPALADRIAAVSETRPTNNRATWIVRSKEVMAAPLYEFERKSESASASPTLPP